jgi:drug/metabolite transporter (DMT)-like permease
MKNESTKAYVAIGIVSFFWGTTYIATRIADRHMPGLYVSGLRQFTAGSILTGYFLLKGNPLPDLSSFKKLAVQGVLLLCLANGVLAWSLQYIHSGPAAIIAALIPLFITLFSVLMKKNFPFTRWMIVGFMAGFAGIIVIFYEYLDELLNPAFGFGILLAFLSVLSWAAGTVYTVRSKVSLSLMYVVGWQSLIAGIVTILICFISGQYISLSKIPAESWYSLLYLVSFGSLLAYSCYVFAISKLPAAQVSIYAYINPIVAVGLGWLMLGEKMTFNIVVGTIITLGGVYLVNREFRKQEAGRINREKQSIMKSSSVLKTV